MINQVLKNRSEISKNHYVRKADPDNEYWVDFSRNKLDTYRERFGNDFCLIIAGSEDSEFDFYQIPFSDVEEFFVDSTMTSDKEERNRWVANILPPHRLRVWNAGEKDAEAYYGNQNQITSTEQAGVQVFGEISGYPVGSTFESRNEIKAAGLHKYPVNGISRILGVGCDCIVLNGGYVDDKDFGDEIWYTGEGGQATQAWPGEGGQAFHQELIRGNLDLSKNKYSRQPIRVIRGYKHFEKRYTPTQGYRYDGLYYLEDYWPDIGEQGYRIWRYKLVKEPNTDLPPSREDSGPAPRRERTTSQIQRDPNIPLKLKKLYGYNCQVCGIRLQANGIEGVVGAHIKGLGEPHSGPDKSENMIVLCPNHHFLFDAFAFSVNDDFSLVGIDGDLTKDSKHKITLEYLQYHRNLFDNASLE